VSNSAENALCQLEEKCTIVEAYSIAIEKSTEAELTA
jgi:hypothetical protein